MHHLRLPTPDERHFQAWRSDPRPADPALLAYIVNCSSYILMAEDWHAENASFRYGQCVTPSGSTVYLTDASQAGSLSGVGTPFAIEVVQLAASDAALRQRHGRGPRPLWHVQQRPEMHIRRLIGPQPLRSAPPPRRRAQSVEPEERDVLVIRWQYLDAEPTYCYENCAHNSMWGSVGSGAGGVVQSSVDALYQESSWGAVRWPSSKGRVVTAWMGKHMSTLAANCPIDAEASHAETKVLLQFGIDPGQYTHREHLVPSNLPGCFWGGIAILGCAASGVSLPRPGACRSWIRDPYPVTRAHEFGHK